MASANRALHIIAPVGELGKLPEQIAEVNQVFTGKYIECEFYDPVHHLSA